MLEDKSFWHWLQSGFAWAILGGALTSDDAPLWTYLAALVGVALTYRLPQGCIFVEWLARRGGLRVVRWWDERYPK